MAVMDLRDQLQRTLGSAYSLERELGGGGMSRVFVADEVRLGRKVVVKVLSPELAAGISAERFELEIKLAASLQQANIVPVLSAGDMSGLPYYTMPLVEGESLRARLAKSPPPGTTDILRILGDVARALQYAHERGIVHRDIKPDNVLLSGGTAVVTDFGIAKALAASRGESAKDSSALTMMGTSIGTPMYMAPEQAAGDPDIDHRVDLYAFGCLAYELLAGHPPFHGRTSQRILAAQMSEIPAPIAEIRPDIPGALSTLIMRCLAKDANDRPRDASEIVHALDAVTSGGGMNALPPVLMYAPGAFRKALFVYLACAIGVVVVAKAATAVIGLPDWVVPSSMFVMLLGLPVILFTGYVQSVTRRALLVTPTMTPGGSTAPRGTMQSIAMKASPHLSWRRATRGGIYAFGAFVALVIAFMITRAIGVGPAASLFAKGVIKADDRILVAEFEAPPSDTSIGSVVSDGVRSNLAQSKSLTIVPASQVAEALGRMQKPATTRLDLPVARELAQREGYRAIVDGKVTPVGNGGFIVTVRLLGAETGDDLASFREVARDASELIPVIDKLTKDLRGKVGESLRAVRAAPTLEHATTSSLPALRKYTEGYRANAVQNYTTAIAAFEEAIKLDTNFAQAYRRLYQAYGNARLNPERGEVLREKAFQLRGHLPEAERISIEAAYYESGPHEDREKSMEAYRRVLELDPTNISALNQLGVRYSQRREYAKAESLYRVGAKVAPTNTFFRTNRITALLNQNRIDEAFEAYQDFRRDFPASPSMIAGHVAANRFGLDSARAACQRVANTENLQARGMAEGCIGAIAITRGQISAAFTRLRSKLGADSARGVSTVGFATTYRISEAGVLAWFLGKHDFAARIVDSAASRIPLDSLPLTMVDAPRDIIEGYALANRPEKARAFFDRWMASMDTARRRLATSDIHFSLGRIAIAEKKYDVAIREFMKADTAYDGHPTSCNRCNLPELANAYDLAGDREAARRTYEMYLAPPLSNRWALRDQLYLASTYKRLGELHEEKGDLARAIEYFSKFVDLWKNADPELQPRVAETRARIARLQKVEARGR